MKQSGFVLYASIAYLVLVTIVALVTARVVSNAGHVAMIVQGSERDARVEAIALARLRDDCFDARSLELTSDTWLQIDGSTTMWFIDDAGLRRFHDTQVEVFRLETKSPTFKLTDDRLALRIGERMVPLPKLQKGKP